MDLQRAESWVAERKLYRDTIFILPEQGNAEGGGAARPRLDQDRSLAAKTPSAFHLAATRKLGNHPLHASRTGGGAWLRRGVLRTSREPEEDQPEVDLMNGDKKYVGSAAGGERPAGSIMHLKLSPYHWADPGSTSGGKANCVLLWTV